MVVPPFSPAVGPVACTCHGLLVSTTTSAPCRDITVPECCRTWDSACVSPLREMSLIWQKKRTELGAQGRAARASLLPSKPSGQPVRGPGRRCWIQRLHQSFHYGKAAWNPLGASPWNLRRPHALFGPELREVGLLKAAYFGIWCRTMQSLFCCKMPEIHASEGILEKFIKKCIRWHTAVAAWDTHIPHWSV